jgi:hypothetical protein
MTFRDFDENNENRRREYKLWSEREMNRLLHGNLNELEGVIAGEGLEDFEPAVRVKLVEGFVRRCETERVAEPAVPTSERRQPQERPQRAYRSPVPLAEATLPARPAGSVSQLSGRRAIAWAVILWMTPVALGLGTLYVFTSRGDALRKLGFSRVRRWRGGTAGFQAVWRKQG